MKGLVEDFDILMSSKFERLFNMRETRKEKNRKGTPNP